MLDPKMMREVSERARREHEASSQHIQAEQRHVQLEHKKSRLCKEIDMQISGYANAGKFETDLRIDEHDEGLIAEILKEYAGFHAAVHGDHYHFSW